MPQSNEEIAKLSKASKIYARGSGESGLGPFMDRVGAALEQLLAEKAQLEDEVRKVNSRLEQGKGLLRQEMQRAVDRGAEVLALRRQLNALQTGAAPAAHQGPDLPRLTVLNKAVSAIYFADDDYYKPALRAVVAYLDPELAELLANNPHEAFMQAEDRLEDAKEAVATKKEAS